jgi:hypothetical protein
MDAYQSGKKRLSHIADRRYELTEYIYGLLFDTSGKPEAGSQKSEEEEL